MIERKPVAYIRRSVARRGDPGDVSREFQTVKVRALANGDGPNLRIVDSDWGVSAGTDKTVKRLAFLAMLDDIERGEISHVYAYSPDRLARSVEWSARLVNVCRRAGVPITTTAGTVAPDDPSARAMFNMLAVMNETALDEMERKAQATNAAREARGDDLGPPPYGMKVVDGKRVDNPAERVETLIDAYRRAGTLQGAARLLTTENVPTRSGKPWRATTLRGILDRAEVLPRRLPRGRTPARSYVFAKLLRCPCGATMTGRVNTKGRRGFAYECKRAAMVPDHGPYSVSEARILPLIRAEAARLRPPHDRVAEGSAGDELEALDRRRDALIDLYLDDPNRLTKAQLDERLAKIDQQRERLADRLEAETIVVDVPPAIDWSQPVNIINEILRAIWERVELGPDLMPKQDGFVWRRAEWRA